MELDFPFVLVLFALALVVQLFYHFFFFSRVAFHRPKTPKPLPTWPPLSVVIAARNEAENLKKFLPKVLEQDYPEFQVIVVDDCSVDDTALILNAFKKEYPHLHVTSILEGKNFEGGKKFAISLGIKAARYDYLVFTDADCYPGSNQWLRHYATALEGRPVALGYGGYLKQEGMLNSLIRFEAGWIALQYLSFARAGAPYMGVGRNMGYHQHLFFDIGGFTKHLDLKSGDDDLFINAVATPKNTAVLLHPDAFTFSPAKSNWKAYIRQKKRHLTTATRYKLSSQMLLVLYTFTQWLFYGALIGALLTPFWWMGLIGFGIRLLTQLLTLFFAFKLMKMGSLAFFGPIFELFFMIFYPFLALSNKVDQFNAWKKKQ